MWLKQKKNRSICINEDNLDFLSSTFIHDLRTSLVALQSGMNSLKKALPELIKHYEGKEKDTETRLFDADYLKNIEETLKNSDQILSRMNYRANKFMHATQSNLSLNSGHDLVTVADVLSTHVDQWLTQGLIEKENCTFFVDKHCAQFQWQCHQQSFSQAFAYLFDNLHRLYCKGEDNLSITFQENDAAVDAVFMVFSTRVASLKEAIFEKYPDRNPWKFGEGLFYFQKVMTDCGCHVAATRRSDCLTVTVSFPKPLGEPS